MITYPIEIISPSEIKVEYWLLYKHLTSMYSTSFTYLDARITVNGVDILDGELKNVECSTRGHTVKEFSVTFKDSQVKNTNVILKNSEIKDWWEYELNQVFT